MPKRPCQGHFAAFVLCHQTTKTGNMKQTFIALIAAMLFVHFTGTAANAQQSFTISGIVRDSINVLAGATVELSNAATHKQVVCDSAGHFSFGGIGAGNYRLQVKMVGYKLFIQENLLPATAGFVTVILETDPAMLGQVVVQSQARYIEMKSGTTVVNLSQSPLAATDNLYDAVKRAPGVTSLQSLQYMGKTVTVAIDGRPLRLSGAELEAYLSAMPASQAEKIELISHPSARYEAGSNAIINIKMARNKNYGTNGRLRAGMGVAHYARLNAGASLNYRNARLNLYGSYDINSSKTRSYNTAHRKLSGNETLQESQHWKDRPVSQQFTAGLDYTVNSKSNAGLLIKGLFSDKKRTGNITSSRYFQEISADSSAWQQQAIQTSLTLPSITVFYNTKLGKTGQLALSADQLWYKKGGGYDYRTAYLNVQGELLSPAAGQRSEWPGEKSISTFSADYQWTAGKINWESGLRGILSHSNNKANWYVQENGGWKTDVQRTNNFIYDENIGAAYLTARLAWKKIELSAGLRYEQTWATGYSVQLHQKDRRNYGSLFPQADMSYAITDDQQLSFSYSRKIERFGFDLVNPFRIYQGAYAYSQGNPRLRPGFSNNFEAGWSKGNQWMASVSYSRFTQVLAEVYRLEPGSIMVSSYENVAAATQWMGNLSHIRFFMQQKLQSIFSLGGLYAAYHAPAGSNLNKSIAAAFLSSNNVYKISSSWKMELNGSYYSPLQFGVYRFREQFEMNAGISHTLLKKNGTISFSVSDIFNTNKRRYTLHSYDVYASYRNNPETRVFKLSFSWAFGNKQVKAAKNRKAAIDEMKQRIDQ